MSPIAVSLVLAGAASASEPIDRLALVRRHNVELTEPEPVQVGNGEFAFSADLTGLQTFEPYNTMSHWGWHSMPLPPGVEVDDFRMTEKTTYSGRTVPYPLPRDDAISRWLPANPHRFNLGRIGLRMTKADGVAVAASDINNARQTLDLWSGLLTSRFEVEGQLVEVETCCHPYMDAVAVRVRSSMIAAGRLKVELRFPYPDLHDGRGDWTNPDGHQTRLSLRGEGHAHLLRTIDDTTYHVGWTWTPGGKVEDLGEKKAEKTKKLVILKAEYGAGDTWIDVTSTVAAAVKSDRISLQVGNGTFGDPIVGRVKTTRITYTLDGENLRKELPENADFQILQHESLHHHYTLTPAATDVLEFVCAFSPEPLGDVLPSVDEVQAASGVHWPAFWNSGGAIDLSGSTDPRAMELERRIVLSQYLMAVNEAGSLPPQESGLVNNGWYGRWHFEMIWWHAAHYALWDRWPLVRSSLDVYSRFLPLAKEKARRQGYAGARWPKCTGPNGTDWPHPIEAQLIWQQPHPIFFAELEYRANPSEETLEAWRELVFETAEFMASLVCRDEEGERFVLGPPMHVVSENTNPDTTINPTFELGYWRYGLRTAQVWRERLGLPRQPAWDEVLEALAPLPVEDGRYVLHEGIQNMWTQWNWEHPALSGVYGLLPGDGVDLDVMRRTFSKAMETWQFGRTWGWDFPMMAMCGARLGEADDAIDLLLHEKFQFTKCGLSTSGPFPYFPSNGGLLYAVALMAAGWDSSAAGFGGEPTRDAPGFPADGRWTVRWEGLKRAP